MKTSHRILIKALPIATALGLVCHGWAVPPAETKPNPATPAAAEKPPLPSVPEARVRARLLHAALQGSLTVIHRDFFLRDEHKIVPSKSMQDVFKVLGEDLGVQVRWIAGDETLMNDENKPRDAFETKALTVLGVAGKEFEAVENDRYRFAGVIPLQNQCLKCHVPGRKNLQDRFAGLSISMSVAAGTGKAELGK